MNIDYSNRGQWHTISPYNIDPPPPEYFELANDFIPRFGLKLAGLGGVNHVTLTPSYDVRVFVSSISKRIRRKIYNMEFDILGAYPNTPFDFHIVWEGESK